MTLEAAAELLAEVKPREAIYALAWNPNGKELATGDASGVVTLWDLETGLEKRRLEGTSRAVHSLTFSPCGRWLAAGSDAGKVRLWDLDTSGQARLFKGWSVAFSPRGESLAIGTKDGLVKIQDPRPQGAELLRWRAHNERIAVLAWHPEGTALATGSWDRTVKVWDSSDGRFLRRLKEDHGERVNGLSWSSGGDLLASAAADSTVRIWDPETGEELRRLGDHSVSATAVVWHPEGHTVASASRDSTVRLWSYISGREMVQLEDHLGEVFAVDFNPSGSLLASGSEEGLIGIWDFSTGALVRWLGGEVNPVETLAFGHEGRSLATGSKGNIRLWTEYDGPPQAPVTLTFADDRAPRCLALGGADDQLAAGLQDGHISWWRRSDDDPRSFESQASLPTYTYAVEALAFSPGGERLAAGFADGTIQVWDLATQEVYFAAEYPRTEDDPRPQKSRSLAFSPDGRRLLGGFADGSFHLWDIESQKQLPLPTQRTEGEPLAVRFVSPSMAIVVLHNGEVLDWDTARGTIQTIARLDHRLQTAAIGAAGELLASVGDREALVRIASLRTHGTFNLSRVLLGGVHNHHWVDCRSQGRCYRYDDGSLIYHYNDSGELEPVPLQRSVPAPELELDEPLPAKIQLADGEMSSIRIKLKNPGPRRAVWVRVRQTDLELRDPIVFYPPPAADVVEPGKTIELQCRISMGSTYENPAAGKVDLKLVVTSADGKHLFLNPIRVTNTVATAELRGARVSFGGARLSVDLANTGVGSFSADHVAIRSPYPIGPFATDVFRNLSVGQKARFVWKVPVERELSTHLDFVAYRTRLPVHSWSFENQRVLRFPFDRPWLYLALLLILLASVAYFRPRIASRRPSIGVEHSSVGQDAH